MPVEAQIGIARIPFLKEKLSERRFCAVYGTCHFSVYEISASVWNMKQIAILYNN